VARGGLTGSGRETVPPRAIGLSVTLFAAATARWSGNGGLRLSGAGEFGAERHR